MTPRWLALQMSATGYQKSGIHLVGWDGSGFVPTEVNDDSGLDYFVPILSSTLHLTLAQAFDLFIAGTMTLCCAAGLVGLFLGLKSRWLKIWALVEVLSLGALWMWVGDVYVVQSAVVLLVIPWVLFFLNREHSRWHVLFFLAAGVALGLANFVRAQAGLPVLLFAICVVLLNGKYAAKRKVALLTALIVGTAAVVLFSRHAFTVRDAYLREQRRDYVPASRQHPLWHTVYIGLGFISTPYVAGGYCDQVGFSEAQTISPGIRLFSPDYDHVLKSEVYNLTKAHPYVLLTNLAAKLGVLQMMALFAGNIGLLAAFLSRKLSFLDAGFFAAAACGAIPGLLAIPVPKYLEGGITVIVLYGVVRLDPSFEENSASVPQWLRGWAAK